MPKPRRDKDKNISRHAATNKDECIKMGRKYGWQLRDIEPIDGDPVFNVDCVFEGETEFPQHYQEQE